jgi:hypothetical protein
MTIEALFDDTPPRFGKRPIVLMVQDGTETNIAVKESFSETLSSCPAVTQAQGFENDTLPF